VPGYLEDIEDAKLLGVRPWELADVPMHWRHKARIVSVAKKEALQEIAKKAKIGAVYILEI
jgi:hypothetical protein